MDDQHLNNITKLKKKERKKTPTYYTIGNYENYVFIISFYTRECPLAHAHLIHYKG
jgi:hypothetical protein